MTNTEFLDDLAARSARNGGNPIEVRGEDIHRLWCLSRGTRYIHDTAMLSGNTLRPLIKLASTRMAEQVAFSLHPVQWVTRDRRSIYPTQMLNSNLQKTYRMLSEDRMLRPTCNGLTNKQWMRVFENELIKRGLVE